MSSTVPAQHQGGAHAVRQEIDDLTGSGAQPTYSLLCAKDRASQVTRRTGVFSAPAHAIQEVAPSECSSPQATDGDILIGDGDSSSRSMNQ